VRSARWPDRETVSDRLRIVPNQPSERAKGIVLLVAALVAEAGE
jgi:hypothetical protein